MLNYRSPLRTRTIVVKLPSVGSTLMVVVK
ncbi:UNVERIFIED_CONTAM: hypothetical protein GTU68_062169 [Idotea baltica]|nr:hypothetical protein [Idotea baltica]